MWWHKQSDLKDDLISVLKDERDVLRRRHEKDCERIDRLMEALARKANIDLVMPMPVIPPTERTYTPNPWKDPSLVTGNFNSPATSKEKQ